LFLYLIVDHGNTKNVFC